MKYFQQSIWIGELKKNRSQSAQHCLPNHQRPGHGASSTPKPGAHLPVPSSCQHPFLQALRDFRSSLVQICVPRNWKYLIHSNRKMHFGVRFHCPVTLSLFVLAQCADWFTDRGHHLSTCYPKQYNWYLGIYVPNPINNYSEKPLITFQIKMLFPSVNSSIQPQPASLSLLGEDKLTKKHVTNLMHFHFAPVSNVTFVRKHAA